MHSQKFFSIVNFLFLVTVVSIAASCSQARNGLSSAAIYDMSEIQTLQCYDSQAELDYACMNIRLNYDLNVAHIEALEMGFLYKDQEVPFRVIARHNSTNEWDLMAENVFSGTRFDATPKQGLIQDYEEWYIETMENYNSAGTAWIGAEAFSGITVFDQKLIWQDLPEKTQNADKVFNPFAQ